MISIHDLSQDLHSAEVRMMDNWGMGPNRLVKRSVRDGIQLTKIFSENNRKLSCLINVNASELVPLNSVFIIDDDVTNLEVTQFITNGIQIISSATLIRTQFNFTGNVNYYARYNFVLRNNPTGKEDRIVTVYNTQSTTVLNESACLERATFSNSVSTNPALICLVFVAIIVVLVVFIIIWFTCCYRTYVVVDIAEIRIKKEFSIENYSLLLEEKNKMVYQETNSSNKKKTFIDTLGTENLIDVQYYIFQLDVSNARDVDEKLKSDFGKFDDTIYTIWLNSIGEQLPNVKERLNQISKQMKIDKDNITKKYQNLFLEKWKNIGSEIIDINNVNLAHLRMTQDAERDRIMQLVVSEDEEEAKANLDRLFELETRNVAIQLKIKQDEALEETKMKCHADMMAEINVSQLSHIKLLIKDCNINADEADAIMKRYIEWQQKLHGINEKEKIRQAASIAFLLENRINQSKKIENQNQMGNEILERKTEYFEATINELEENDDISRETASTILTQFELEKQHIINEMEKAKESQLKTLLERLNETKQKKLQDLKAKQDNEINNLMTVHTTDNSIQTLIPELVNLELKHCREFSTIDAEADDENTENLVSFLQEIGTQTLTKIDDKIVEISSLLKREGFTDRDIDTIIQNSKEKIQKIQQIQQQEREKQEKKLQMRLEKLKEEIETNSIRQSKDQSRIIDTQNEVMNEIMNMQKTLSDEERNKMIEQYTKNKFSLESNLSASRLLQKRKLEDMMNAQRLEKNSNLSNKLNVEIKEIREKSSKKKGGHNTESVISQCVLDFLGAKLNVVNQADSQNELDKELEKIKNEMLDERELLIHKKEEEIATLLNKIQILKAAQHMDLKDEQEKLRELHMVALDSIGNGSNVQEIIKKHKEDKENLDDAIDMNKRRQEEEMKRKLKKREPISLLKEDSKIPNDSENAGVIQRKKQNLENEKLQNNLKSENDLKHFQIESLKSLVLARNYPRSEILDLLREKFPLKTNKEIDDIAEEIYPKSKENLQKEQPQNSLIESNKKITENDQLKYSQSSTGTIRPNSSLSSRSNKPQHPMKEEPLTNQISEETLETVKPRKKKKKKRQIEDVDNEYDEQF